jgi:hypothetical protein
MGFRRIIRLFSCRYIFWVKLPKNWVCNMSFEIMQHDGMKVTQWFFNIDELIKAMINNPKDRYWRSK